MPPETHFIVLSYWSVRPISELEEQPVVSEPKVSVVNLLYLILYVRDNLSVKAPVTWY